MGTSITLTADSFALTITGDQVYQTPTYDKLEGWYDLVAADDGFDDRPDAPGTFEPGQTEPEAPTVSIEGQYFSPIGRADALQMRKNITRLYNNGRPLICTVTDDLETTTREVYILAVKFPWTIHQEFSFTIDMKAADPRRYGDLQIDETGLAAPSAGLDFDEGGTGPVTPSNQLGTAVLGTMTLG